MRGFVAVGLGLAALAQGAEAVPPTFHARGGGRCVRYQAAGEDDPCGFLNGAQVWEYEGSTLKKQHDNAMLGIRQVREVVQNPLPQKRGAGRRGLQPPSGGGDGDGGARDPDWSPGCVKTWREQICAAAIPPCWVENSWPPAEAPRKMCRVACETLHSQCSKALRRLKQDPGNYKKFPKCSAEVNDPSSRDSLMYIDYPEQWEATRMYVDGFYNSELGISYYSSTESESTEPPYTSTADDVDFYSYGSSWFSGGGYSNQDSLWVDCWGHHYGHALDHGDEPFWDEDDPELFAEECARIGGTVSTHTGPGGEEFLECDVDDRRSCLDNGGEWFTFADGNGECFFPNLFEDEFYTDVDYSTSEPSEAWEVPTVELSSEATGDSERGYLLPVEIFVGCEEGSHILMTHELESDLADCDKADTYECLPEPTPKMVKEGRATVLGNGAAYELVRAGVHFARLRSVGHGRPASAEVRVSFKAVRDFGDSSIFLPDADSKQVHLRSWVAVEHGSLAYFDTVLFRIALATALDGELQGEISLRITKENVIVREVEEGRIYFEVRVPEEDAAMVEALLRDPLFAYPLAEQLFEYGLVNATDKCSAAGGIKVDTDNFETLSALTNGLSATTLGIILGVLALFVLLLAAKACQLRSREKSLHRDKGVVAAKEKAVLEKESDLEKRERELADKMHNLEEQEAALISEQKKLAEEQEALEEEAAAAAKEVEEAELEELRELDPEGAETIEEALRISDEAVASQAKSRLKELQDKFRGVMPEEDLNELNSNLGVGKLAFLLRPPQKRAADVSSSDIARLRAFGPSLSSAAKKAEFGQLIDELVKKGCLQEVGANDQDRLRVEYEDAMFKFKNDLYEKKQRQAAKLAARRKKRLDLVIADAKEDPNAGGAGGAGDEAVAGGADLEADGYLPTQAALEREIEEELGEELELEKEILQGTVSQAEYEQAVARLEQQKAEKKRKQLEAISHRREANRKKLEASAAKLEREREEAAKKQEQIALKVSNVFKRMHSVETKVKALKSEHEEAAAQLEEQLKQERQRQREKLLARRKKNKQNTASVTPDN